jgi:hypothetical protein
VRYDGLHCEECARLAAEFAALFRDYLAAWDVLRGTRESDPAYHERLTRVNEVIYEVREAGTRDDLHERTHYDQTSN